MSTSDSEYSIDWLASDEDDHDGSPQTLSPPLAEKPSVPSSSSSSSSGAAASPPCCLRSAAQRRSWRRSSKDGGSSDPVVNPGPGFTCVRSVSVEAELQSNRKRTHEEEEQRSELFSHKCAELQCYIQPLSSILQGLRSGRYSERLSSFQESVAMDRIHRIMGVLQNPGVGGHFLGVLLKIEEMLQSWFPHVRPNTQTDDSTPTKKLKHLSASSPPPSASTSSSPVSSLEAPEAAPCRPARCSSSSSSCVKVMQDNAVSSSTDSKTGSLHLHRRAPLSLKISSPCLERLLQAKDSIITSRTDEDGMWW